MGGRRGNVKVYIDGDASGLGRATKEAETHLGRLGSGVTRAGERLTAAGATLTRSVTLPTLAIGAVAGKTAIDFDAAMRNVNSIAQLPERGLGRLERRVLALAGPTAQAPKTLAEGLYDLVSSGFDANESMFVLDKSARAATAGLTTTEVSAGAVAAVLNAYKLPAKEAGDVSDVLFRIVDRGVISFETLASTVGDVLPFADSLDVNLREVGASIATMTKAGISAPETMTRIKAAMVTLIKPGEDLSNVMEELGYESGESMVKALGFQGTLERLAETTGGSKEELGELFPNVRALGAALALTGGNATVATEDLKGMQNASGSTARALAQQSKSASYEWKQFRAELEETAIKAAPPLLSAGREIVTTLGDVVDTFNDLSPSTKRMIIHAAALAAALGPVLTIGGNILRVAGATIRIADRAGRAFRTIGAGATAASASSSTAAAGAAAGAGTTTSRFAGVRSSFGTYDLARSFGRGRAASAVAQIGATGAAMATSLAGGLASAAGPAIAAVGIGNIVSSAIEGDTKATAYKTGGAIAGSIAGGIAGTFLGGNTALGAMIGGGIGTFLGDALSGVFETERKLTPLQKRLATTAKQVSFALKSQGEASDRLVAAQRRLEQANRRHRRSTDAVRDAQQGYRAAVRKFGPDSLPALQAALRLARAQRQEKEAAEAAQRAHKLSGIQLELFKVRTTQAVAAENRRIPVLRQTVRQLTGKWRSEKDNAELAKRLESRIKALNTHEAKRSRLLQEASNSVSPKWARQLERMGRGVSKFVSESGRIRSTLRALPRDSQTTTEQLVQQWGNGGGLMRAIRRFNGETKTQLQQEAARHMKAFGDQGAGAFQSLAERVYIAEANIGANTTSLVEGLGSSKVPKFTLKMPARRGRGRGHNTGGLVRVPGIGREDTVPLYGRGIEAVVAPGEDLIVANRHQRPELDFAVAHTYGDAGLDGFFARSRRPHRFERGGVAKNGGASSGSTALGVQAAREVLRRIGMANDLPLPQIGGPEPLAGGVGQASVNLVYAAAAEYLRKHAGSPRVRKMIAFAEREAAKGYPYVFGGGHGSFSGPYDCSGYVSAILHAGGFVDAPMTVAQGTGLYVLGQAGAGKQVTWGVRGTSGANAHTMISLKDPRRGWRFFESGSGHGAAEVGGWSGSFQFRHPQGFERGGVVAVDPRASMPAAVRKALARYGPSVFDPRSPHFVGWGYQRGGVAGTAGRKKPGGSRSRIEERFKTAIEKVWRRAAPLYGQSPRKKFQDIAAVHVVPGLAEPGRVAEGGTFEDGSRAIRIDQGWAKKFLRGRDYAEGLLLHEWAHVFQRAGLKKWEEEGGATAFQRYASPIVFGHPPGPYPVGYRRYTERVEREKGDAWIRRKQFRRHQRGGIVRLHGQFKNRGGILKAGRSAGDTRQFLLSDREERHAAIVARAAAKHRVPFWILWGIAGAESTWGKNGDNIFGLLSAAEGVDVTDWEAASNQAAKTMSGLKEKTGGWGPAMHMYSSGTTTGGYGLGHVKSLFKQHAPDDLDAIKPDPDQIPVRGRHKLSYDEKIARLDTRINKASTTRTLKDDRSAAVAKLDLLRGRKKFLERSVRGINKRLRGKLKPPVRERLLQRRESMLSELSGMPGEASGLIESLREAGVTNPKQLRKHARGFGIGVADPNAERPTARDRADLQLARAELTPDKGDDIAALQKLVSISERELQKAEKSGDPRTIAEATRNLQSAAEALRDAQPTAEDFANRDLALAELTETLDDDRVALEAIRSLAQQQLDAALSTADPRDDIEAAQKLKSATDALRSLQQTIEESDAQRRELEEERLRLDKKFAALAEAQGPAMLAALVAYVDGAMGGPVSTRRNLATPGVPASFNR